MSADKREGDGGTPVGDPSYHRACFIALTGLRDLPNDWADCRSDPRDLWSDAMRRNADYNHMVRTPYAHSHERLRRGGSAV